MTSRLIPATCAILAALAIGFGTILVGAWARATPQAASSGSIPPVVWQLLAIETAGGPTAYAEDPSRYAVQFIENGLILVRADCNRGSGTYAAEGYGLTIPPFATTLVLCEPPTLDTQFVAGLLDTVAFAYARDTLVLTLRDGKGAMVFAPSLIGVTWTLQEIQGGSAPTIPGDPNAYTLTFGEDRHVAVRADCNQGSGAYQVSGSQIAIGPVATTRVACPPGSLYDQFMQAIEAAATFTFSEGHLLLSVSNDAGTLIFSARGTETGPATPAAG